MPGEERRARLVDGQGEHAVDVGERREDVGLALRDLVDPVARRRRVDGAGSIDGERVDRALLRVREARRAWSFAMRTTLPPAAGPVPTSTLPSASATAQVAVVPASAGSGTLPSVQPARTTPSEPTLTPLRSPPESFSSESSSNVRVPTARASPAKAAAAAEVRAKTARKRMVARVARLSCRRALNRRAFRTARRSAFLAG